MPFDIHVIDVAASIAGVVTAYLYLRSRGVRLPLPPGPRKLPIIGNALDIPSEFPRGLCRSYSDIIHLNAFGTDIIVLGSHDAAQELLEKRSSIYSSRPNSVMLTELGGYPYLFYFHPRNTEIYQPRETEHVHTLLGKLLDSPEKFMSHIRHIWAEIKPEDDPYIDISENALETLVEMLIPEWFPGARFHQVAKKARKDSEQVLNVPYSASVAAMNTSEFYYEGSMDTPNRHNVDQSQHIQTLKEIGVMTYLGAMDTTNASLGMFILTMMLFPEVQKTAQQELDKVLGGRLPDHNDIPSIPYMTALLWEILRWETPVPTGFPHYNIEEDIFNGYYIPKESVIIVNQRAMLHDERDYPDPHHFKPERFLKDGKLNDTVRNPKTLRLDLVEGEKCPGRHLAKSSLWFAMASILSTFNIEKPVDKDGKAFEPTYKFGNGGVNHVEPFACSIKPRSEKAISLVNSVSGSRARQITVNTKYWRIW
ncbi:cytochrome P450 [Cyathus striatus]|nr:cytochrome P450 [Cyathus striatus]